ncbi:MAG: hypothetical protein HY303_21790, partial [Candidatus Wallbacteria bacterium]|nr:hypothetical protein [Candidatus Wallbacteria bacterium]
LDLNWTYTGRGCIVSPKTVRVTGARKVKADDTLTIVSTLGSIDLSGASDTVQAALFATTGTVIGLSGKHIHGVLAAAHLASGFESGSDTRIDLDKELTRHQPGAMEAGPDSLQVHFDDVPLAQF